MEKILSFDCANRSLAVCYASINKNAYNTLISAIKSSTDTKQLYLDYVKIHFIKVYDLTRGVKLDTVQRAILLKAQLKEIDENINQLEDSSYSKVLVEYQMSANDKSRNVSNQIIYHYCDKAATYSVGPSLKNKVDFSSDLSLSHGDFLAKYSSKYTANKNHTKNNFLYYLIKTDNKEILKSLCKKNYDDAADSFLQIIGFVNKQLKIIDV